MYAPRSEHAFETGSSATTTSTEGDRLPGVYWPQFPTENVIENATIRVACARTDDPDGRLNLKVMQQRRPAEDAEPLTNSPYTRFDYLLADDNSENPI